MPAILPTSAFSGVTLDIATIAPGEEFGRIHRLAYPDPLSFGKNPTRFSDPRKRIPANRFGVLYLGSSLKVCFVETILRDERDDGRGSRRGSIAMAVDVPNRLEIRDRPARYRDGRQTSRRAALASRHRPG